MKRLYDPVYVRRKDVDNFAMLVGILKAEGLCVDLVGRALEDDGYQNLHIIVYKQATAKFSSKNFFKKRRTEEEYRTFIMDYDEKARPKIEGVKKTLERAGVMEEEGILDIHGTRVHLDYLPYPIWIDLRDGRAVRHVRL